MATQSGRRSSISFENFNKALQDIYKRFEFIYSKGEAYYCLERLEKLLAHYSLEFAETRGNREEWSEEDILMITYGDSIFKKERKDHKLAILEKFLESFLKDTVSSLHILPFFPFSSDGGFSVIDYKKVRDDLGTWKDIERLTAKYNLMADLVINHISRKSTWFQNFKDQVEPGKDYFLDIDPNTDLSAVTRPRSSPLLTEVETENGTRYVWTTFSDDQVDLDFSNPDVLFEFIDIFLFYLSKGINIVRLDAIAYLWKKVGSSSIHLPQTHEIVKLFRDIVDYINPSVTLITETNVPFEENISYFGDGDEAHMIYQFSLPPLLLHALLTENASYLSEWAANLPDPPEGCTYFNFTSSHDGIGVRPLEGLVPEEEFNQLIESTKERGGYISYKGNPNGTKSPYELNITYFDAFSDPENNDTDLQYQRYMCSQIIMMSLRGLPALYIHNFTGTQNDIQGVIESQNKRDINRKQWDYEDLVTQLENEESITHKVFYTLKRLIAIRKQHPAFSPGADQQVLTDVDNLFVFLRTAPDNSEQILVTSNVTGEVQTLKREDVSQIVDLSREVSELIEENVVAESEEIVLQPFQTLWLRL